MSVLVEESSRGGCILLESSLFAGSGLRNYSTAKLGRPLPPLSREWSGKTDPEPESGVCDRGIGDGQHHDDGNHGWIRCQARSVCHQLATRKARQPSKHQLPRIGESFLLRSSTPNHEHSLFITCYTRHCMPFASSENTHQFHMEIINYFIKEKDFSILY